MNLLNDERIQTHRFQQMLYELCTGLYEWPEDMRAKQPASLPDMVFCSISYWYARNPWQWTLDLKAAHERRFVQTAIEHADVLRLWRQPLLWFALDGMIKESSQPLMSLEPSFASEDFDFGTARLQPEGKIIRATASAICGMNTGIATKVEACGISVDGSPLKGTPINLFRPRTVPEDGVWRQMWLLCEERREEFAAYCAEHPKGGIKVVTTNFRTQIQSDDLTGIVNEVLAKFLAYNIWVTMRGIRELGISRLVWEERLRRD